jgi:Domain of unknown function (DUF4129)
VQLDRLAVQLRLRNPWEAIDLGFAMVRTWARTVYAAWLVLFVPLCVLALLVLPARWAVVLVWWLLPALDRVVLHVLAAGVFGDLPRLRDTLRALPRALTPGLIASLTWYRFFLVRSFNLPVWQLERQTGADARQRRRQLHRRTSGHATWLTWACIFFELVLALSGIALFDLLAPVLESDQFQFFQLFTWKNHSMQQIVLCATVFAGMAIVEPFYVAGGFALYLNRRTALEGWDLEVALRRMGERMQAAARGVDFARAAALVVALVGLLALQAPAEGYAQDTPAGDTGAPGETQLQPGGPSSEELVQPSPAPASEAPALPPSQRRAAREIKEVLKRPEFDQYRERLGLEYFGKRQQPKPARRVDSPGWASFIEALAQFLRILAYAAIGLAVVFLLYHLLRRFDLVGRKSSAYVPPTTLFGLDVRPESLPADVASAALELARAGELLKALSLLYRGALVTLLHRDGVELASGDTEEDCLRKSRRHIPDPSIAYFARLLAAWQRLAYARREVPNAEVETLCGDWRAHFTAGNPGAAT